MNKFKSVFAIGLLILMIMPPSAALSKGYGNKGGGGWTDQTGTSTPYGTVYYNFPDAAEVADLVFMRQEEKLARDVYLTLYHQWEDPVFLSISRSEERHMQSLKSIIDKYGLSDPVTADNIGLFSNLHLQALYNQLVAEGSQSLLDALRVGATIEDLDISDLQEALKNTNNQDIRAVYQNLMKGSHNHLRQFVRSLSSLGESYEAQHLTQEAVDAIVAGAMERGRVDADGNPANFGKRRRRGYQ